ncbi:MAG: TonB-dependent receptor [Pseudomonadota bacterium]
MTPHTVCGAHVLRRLLPVSLLLTALTGHAQPSATAPDTADDTRRIEEVIVTSSRRGATLDDLARSALVLDESALKPFQERGSSVQELLARTIPGFAPPTTEGSAASLTLRGRTPLFLLDGVPIAGNTNFARYLDKFDALTIGRTEVIYGPTTLYGAGATGGVIQMFTRDPNVDKLEVEIGTQVNTYLADGNAFDDDGTSTKVFASARGKLTDKLSVYGFASYEETAGVFRSDGELMLGRNQFTDDQTLIGKLRYQLTPNQAVTALYNVTEQESQDRASELIGVTTDDGTQIAEELDQAIVYVDPPRNEFTYSSINYEHSDLFEGELAIQLYYSESDFLNPGGDTRDLQGFFPNFPGLWQSGRVTEEQGLRLQFTRYLGDQVSIVVGGDYNDADSESLLPISDVTVFEETGVYDASSQGLQTAPYTIEALGFFVEASYDVTDRFTLAGGIRWDEFDYDIQGPFTPSFALTPGERVGGEGSDNDTSFNLGATFALNTQTTLYGNYSEGFTIPSLGFIANDLEPGVPVNDSALVAPVITESYELGMRGSVGVVGYNLALYTTESEFTTSIAVDPATGFGIRGRAPVDISGIEASADWRITERLTLGGSLTYVEGDVTPDGSGETLALSSQEVPPIKVLINPSYLISADLTVFGQVLFVDDRDDAFEDGVDANPVDSYTLVDVGLNWTPGDFQIGLQVTNLLNEDYVPAGEISFLPGRIRSGPGRAATATLRYSF